MTDEVAPVAIGKAPVPVAATAEAEAEPEAVGAAATPGEPEALAEQPAATAEQPAATVDELVATAEQPEATEAETEASAEQISTRQAVAVRDAVTQLDAAAAFLARGAIRMSSTRVVAERFVRAEPSAAGRKLLSREWRCHEPECPAFGGYREIGQPVPRMRDGKSTCPRHGSPVTDIGPRPPAYPVAVVVDDLPRLRFVVDPSHPVTVGKAPSEPGVSVAAWLHSPAAAWIAPSHLRLAVENRALVVTDTSENGTLVWRRGSSTDPGSAERIRRSAYQLGEWDSLELYTGVELVVGNWYHTTVVATSDVDSVMAEAPTVVLRGSEISV